MYEFSCSNKRCSGVILCRLTDLTVEQRVYVRVGIYVCVWMHACACLCVHVCSYGVFGYACLRLRLCTHVQLLKSPYMTAVIDSISCCGVHTVRCTGACVLACVNEFVYMRAFVHYSC